MEGPIAEVIASKTSEFTAELFRGVEVPALGQWLRVERPDGRVTYGLISHLEIAPYDQNRRPEALGRSRDELRMEMPHVLELIRTVITVSVCAQRDASGRLRQSNPAHPVYIHDFVYACDEEHTRAMAEPYDYLRTLVNANASSSALDDLLVAVLTGIHEAHGTDTQLVQASRALSRLFKDDHERLQSILRRVV